MIIIVGLGNPGKEFEGTRHNTGYLVVDRLARETDTDFKREDRFQSLIARPNNKYILVKPTTFMNLSGQAVGKLTTFYKLKPTDVWVVYDDVDLPVGTARSREAGRGQTRHKGIRSIAEAIGSYKFPRFRIGIASATETPLNEFVLAPFDKREQKLVEQAVAWVVTEIQTSLKNGRVISRTLTKGI